MTNNKKKINIYQEQKEWIESGKIGCMFASVLVKDHDSIGWNFQVNPKRLEVPKGCFILSIVFTDKNAIEVREWALDNGFYIDNINEMYEGLRIRQGLFVSWVQYFGPDSHVETRKAPYPMLSFACKLPSDYYYKVGFNGILHLAHASVGHLTKKVTDILWKRSEEKTKKVIGKELTIREAAKTTFVR